MEHEIPLRKYCERAGITTATALHSAFIRANYDVGNSSVHQWWKGARPSADNGPAFQKVLALSDRELLEVLGAT